MDSGPRAKKCQTLSAHNSDANIALLKGGNMDEKSTEFHADDRMYDLGCADSLEERTFGSEGRQPFKLTEISDFSPDWDFKDGGAKVLICLAASLPESVAHDTTNLFVQFGAKRTCAEVVSDTVLRCTGTCFAHVEFRSSWQPRTILILLYPRRCCTLCGCSSWLYRCRHCRHVRMSSDRKSATRGFSAITEKKVHLPKLPAGVSIACGRSSGG